MTAFAVAPPPTGHVAFAGNSSGWLSAPACGLVPGGGRTASCSVTYTPGAVESGTHKIYANYQGDAYHTPSYDPFGALV